MEIFQKDELIVFKLNGLSNIKILNILLLISLMVALMVNILLLKKLNQKQQQQLKECI